MTISERLKKSNTNNDAPLFDGDNAASAPTKQRGNNCGVCGHALLTQSICIDFGADKPMYEVCAAVICAHCNKLQKINNFPYLYFYNGEFISFKYKDFRVPKEFCQSAVYDKAGLYVGRFYDENKKIEFVKKLAQLIKTHPMQKYFTPQEIESADAGEYNK